MIRSLLLDLDGTLINSERGFAKCFVDVLNNNFGCNATTTDYINYELRQNTQLINHFRSLGKLDGVSDDEIMSIVYSNYTDYFLKAIKEEEAKDNFRLLRKLKEQAYILSLVTTCRREYLDILDKHEKIYHIFSSVIARNDVDKKELKPNPKAYLMALEQTGIKANEGLAIEDTVKGIDAALEAGLMAIQVSNFSDRGEYDLRAFQEKSANIVLRRIYEEKKYIK